MTKQIEQEKILPEISESSQKIIESIENMTVLELSKLVKVLENKFGIVANAPTLASEENKAKSSDTDDNVEDNLVSVVLTGCGNKKIQVLKAVRELTGLGLKEAKSVVDNVPKSIKEGIEKNEAEKIKQKLEEQGAQVEIK